MAKGTSFLSGFGDFSKKKQAGASPPAALPEPQVEKKNITRNTSPQIYNGTKNETDNNQGKFRSDIATKLIREHRYIFVQEQLWGYNSKRGCFELLGKGALRHQVELAINNHQKNSSYLTKSIIDEISRRQYVENYVFNHNKYLLNFRDCVYDVENNEIYEHSCDFGFNYVLTAEIENHNDLSSLTFNKFIDTLCGGVKTKRKRLQEMCGVLISNIVFKGAVFFIGEHDTGKSTLARLLRYLIGENHVSAVSLDVFDRNFALSQMRNKRLNVAGEISRKVKPSQFKSFKEITGGDSVFVDIKNKESQSVTFTAKQLFLGNFLPDFPTDDDSIYGRFNVIYFDNTVPREERDPDLFDKLIEDIDYFAWWYVKGLLRYIKNDNSFTKDDDSNDYFMYHIEKSNSSMAFVQKFIREGNDDEFITNSELYEIYASFCHENALAIHSRQKLFSNIKEIFPQSKRGREYVDNERPQVIHGIKIYREDII